MDKEVFGTISNDPIGNRNDVEYGTYTERVVSRVMANSDGGRRPIFTTDVADLFDLYLQNVPPNSRQYHNCNTCRKFTEKYGGLVVIDDAGKLVPLVWDEHDCLKEEAKAMFVMVRAIKRSRVTGVFLSSNTIWGTNLTGVWRHLAVSSPNRYVHPILTAEQAMAEKKEDFNNVMSALLQFDQKLLDQAVTILRSDALYRSEKVLGQGEWLADLQRRFRKYGGNMVWLAVGTAPAGYCHPRSSMIGTLLEDLASRMSFEQVEERFRKKMNPLKYQRPQAAPSAGNIEAAEKVVEQLKSAGSLRRRFARIDEIPCIWRPVDSNVGGTVFGGLKHKSNEASGMVVTNSAMTWRKFKQTFLSAQVVSEVEVYIPHGVNRFTSLVTAADPDAPPILQWDRMEKRNPVSWYFWARGSTPESFNLSPGRWYGLSGIAYKPTMWNAELPQHAPGIVLIIDGARDQRTPSLCLFPEILRSEYRGIRSVIEAYSNANQMEGGDKASAAGLMFSEGEKWDVTLRIKARGVWTQVKIDRWD